MSLSREHALVLQVNAQGEQDKRLIWYGAQSGRVTAIAKGAQKSKQRFVNKLELFSLLDLAWQAPRQEQGLSFIREAELLDSHLSLRTDYRKYLAASYLVELVLSFSRERDRDPPIFFLLCTAFAALNRCSTFVGLLVFSHLHLLALAGYRPNLHQCGSCLTTLSGEISFIFTRHEGGLRCSACQRRSRVQGVSPSWRVLELCHQMQASSLERIGDCHLSNEEAIPILDALHLHSLHLLQVDIHVWPLLRRELQGQTER